VEFRFQRLQICLRSRCLRDDRQTAANYPLVRNTNNKTGHVFYSRAHDHTSRAVESGALGSTHFDVPATQRLAPTKPDNTQTGHVEIREVDIVSLPHPRLAMGNSTKEQ